jgi:hypothetical protein
VEHVGSEPQRRQVTVVRQRQQLALECTLLLLLSVHTLGPIA